MGKKSRRNRPKNSTNLYRRKVEVPPPPFRAVSCEGNEEMETAVKEMSVLLNQKTNGGDLKVVSVPLAKFASVGPELQEKVTKIFGDGVGPGPPISYQEAISIWHHEFQVFSVINNFSELLKREKKLILAAQAFEREKSEPPTRPAYIYFRLGETINVEKMLGTDQGDPQQDNLCEEACLYFYKAFELIEKGGILLKKRDGDDDTDGTFDRRLDEQIMRNATRDIVHISFMRNASFDPNESIRIVERLIKCAPKELLSSDVILFMIRAFKLCNENGHLVGLLSSLLSTIIEPTWSVEHRVRAYEAIGNGYFNKLEYENAKEYYDRALSIAPTQEIKFGTLLQQVTMYNVLCNVKKSANFLCQIEEILSKEKYEDRKSRVDKFWDDRMMYFMERGNLFLLTEMRDDRKKYCDQEALEQYEKALEICEEHNLEHFYLYLHRQMGHINSRLGHWEIANEHFNLSVECLRKRLADRKLRKFCMPGEMSHLCEEYAGALLAEYKLCKHTGGREQEQSSRTDLLDKIENLCMITPNSEIGSPWKHRGYLHLAQVKYFKGQTEEAKKNLSSYFSGELEKEGGNCRICNRRPGIGQPMVACGECYVVEYCCKAHQKLDWRTELVSHKVLCPFLKRWRIAAKSKRRKGVERICEDFFETVCIRSNKDP